LLNNPGNIFVISAPSGTGKSTIAKLLVEKIGGLSFSVSFTTRKPRRGEIDGKDYFFVDDTTFDNMIARNDFVEWVNVYDKRYGTSKTWIEDKLNSGVDILLDIESQGAKKVHKAIPNATMILLIPPSPNELARRLKGRGGESEQQLNMRLERAKHELSQFEEYNYIIVNDTVDEAYRKVEAVVIASRCLREQAKLMVKQILNKF
jgi:guanylate kinase